MILVFRDEETVVLRNLEVFLEQCFSFQGVSDLLPGEYLAISGDVFGCHNSGEREGELLLSLGG